MTPNASLLQHLDHAEADDDVDVDMTTAPDEWAFFPAPASRIGGRRGRLKLVKATRDAGRAVADAGRDVTIQADVAVDEPAATDEVPDVTPVPRPLFPAAPARPVAPVAPVAPRRSADDAMSAADVTDADESNDDVADIDEPPADEELASPDASILVVSFGDDEPITRDEEPVEDDEPTRDAVPDAVYEPASLTEITSLIETDDGDESASDHVADVTDVKKPSPRKPVAPRKPAQRKPAARKTSGSRPSAAPKRSKPVASAIDLPRVTRQRKAESVESDTHATTAGTQEPRARKSTAKRVLVAALALVVIAAGAVVGFLVMRDGTPASPRPAAVDVVTRYAQGGEGVTDGTALGFRAVFPGSPERGSVELPGPDESTTVRYEWLSFTSGDVGFSAGRIAYPDAIDVSDASSVLRKAADGAARAQDGKVESYREMILNGDPAAESVVSTADGTYLHTHAVLHDETLYLLRVESAVETQPGFDRFADSFEVI